jgi:hypothetical protein
MSPAVLGGFNAILAGAVGSAANGGSATGYGSAGFWWSASSGGSAGAWYRLVPSSTSQVSRGSTARYTLFSVRCKKD